MKKTLIYALTPKGARLASKIAGQIEADILLPRSIRDCAATEYFDSLMEAVSQKYQLYQNHIFVAAVGIAIRAIAPYLDRKDLDPAVVALDQKGRFVVSLLSGHIGGANELSRKIARIVDGQAIITTATDIEDIKAIDVLAAEKDMSIANLGAIKTINSALLQDKWIFVYDPEQRLQEDLRQHDGYRIRCLGDLSQMPEAEPGIIVSWHNIDVEDRQSILCLHPRCLVVGLGCNSGTPTAEIVSLITKTFGQHGLSLKSISCLTTTKKKGHEPGLTSAAEELGVLLTTVDHESLQSVSVPNPSRIVEGYMGVPSICEAAALITSQASNLIVSKTKGQNVTLAVALKS